MRVILLLKDPACFKVFLNEWVKKLIYFLERLSCMNILQGNIALNKTNSININGNILNGNNLKFFNNREEILREILNKETIQPQINFKAVILPNINPPYI